VLVDPADGGLDLGLDRLHLPGVADRAVVQPARSASRRWVRTSTSRSSWRCGVGPFELDPDVVVLALQGAGPGERRLEQLLLRELVELVLELADPLVGGLELEQEVELLGSSGRHAHLQGNGRDRRRYHRCLESPARAARVSRSIHAGIAATSVAWWPASISASPCSSASRVTWWRRSPVT
jgi:hypothetical protein